MQISDTLNDFWNHHGIFFLIFITIFPRLTLLFSSVATGGLLWWLGFIFAPRILVAVLATITYTSSNPVLVIIAWVVALSGESGEKYYFRKRVYTPRANRKPPGDVVDVNYERLP